LCICSYSASVCADCSEKLCCTTPCNTRSLSHVSKCTNE
jgi:hypothetical protein